MNATISQMTEALLQAHGWSEAELGRRIGASQSTVNRMRRNPDHKILFSTGQALMKLFEELPSPATDAVA